jgi:hypothetical protein
MLCTSLCMIICKIIVVCTIHVLNRVDRIECKIPTRETTYYNQSSQDFSQGTWFAETVDRRGVNLLTHLRLTSTSKVLAAKVKYALYQANCLLASRTN